MIVVVKILCGFLLFSPLLAGVSTQTCSPTSRYTQPNYILKGHVINTIQGVDSSKVCIAKCKEHGNCHSINYFECISVCEINSANHVSNPESLVFSSDGGEYRNYHERPTDKCSAKLCNDKYLCAVDSSNRDNLYRCCSPAEIALHFPRINTSDHVVIEKPFTRNLTALTISMWLKMANTSLSHPGHKHTPISYALNDNLSNEMMFRFYTYKVVVYINSAGTKISAIDYLDDKWHHFCFTWDGGTQQYAFYVDSNLLSQNSWSWPEQVDAGGALVLGQDQDRYVGGFQAIQSFMGYISKVNMWDRMMTSSEVKDLYSACTVVQEGNVMKWSDLYPTKKKYGEVALVCVNSCV